MSKRNKSKLGTSKTGHGGEAIVVCAQAPKGIATKVNARGMHYQPHDNLKCAPCRRCQQ